MGSCGIFLPELRSKLKHMAISLAVVTVTLLTVLVPDIFLLESPSVEMFTSAKLCDLSHLLNLKRKVHI